MKQLHLIPYFVRATRTGGPAFVARRLASGMQSLGGSVTVATTNANLDEDIPLPFLDGIFETSEAEIKTIYFRRQRILPPTYYYSAALTRWLKCNIQHYDIAVVHGLWTYFGWLTRRVCTAARVPYLCYPHGMVDDWALGHHKLKKMPYWYLIERENLRNCRAVLAQTQHEAFQLKTLGIDTPIFVVRDGVELPIPKVEQPKAVLEQQLPEIETHPYVLFMARLHPKKGTLPLLQAWHQIAKQYPHWRLVVAGPDEAGHFEKLQHFVHSQGLQESVIFTGFVSGHVKTALLQCAQLFVLPSYSEGLPGAVIEALAFGLPVVVTPYCHIPEVNEYGAGITVEPDPIEIAGALKELIVQPRLREQMSHQAGQLVQSSFDMSQITNGYYEFCLSTIKEVAMESPQ